MTIDNQRGLIAARHALINLGFCGPGEHGEGDPEVNAIDRALSLIAAERERCALLCEKQRSSKNDIVAPLTNAAYDEACRDCAAAIRDCAD